MNDRARILEDQVETLARELADTINEAEVPGRPGIRIELRDVAISVLQDGVALAEPEPVVAADATGQTFNPLGMGIPLLLAGVVLFFIFPPVGLFLLAAAAVMIVVGLITMVFSRR